MRFATQSCRVTPASAAAALARACSVGSSRTTSFFGVTGFAAISDYCIYLLPYLFLSSEYYLTAKVY